MSDIKYVPGELVSPYSVAIPEVNLELDPKILEDHKITWAQALRTSERTLALAAAPILGYQGVYQRLVSTFGRRITASALVQLGDDQYWLPSVSYVKAFLKESNLNSRFKWLEERFDCDDFSYALKGEMSKTWYKMGAFQAGFGGGIIWGEFSWVNGAHAVNWFLDDTGVVKLVEPQSDEIYEASECSRVDLLVG